MAKTNQCALCRNRHYSTFYGEDYCLQYEMGECDARDTKCPHYVPETEEDRETHYCPSATAGDYSPSAPWKAPGMKISDFI